MNTKKHVIFAGKLVQKLLTSGAFLGHDKWLQFVGEVYPDLKAGIRVNFFHDEMSKRKITSRFVSLDFMDNPFSVYRAIAILELLPKYGSSDVVEAMAIANSKRAHTANNLLRNEVSPEKIQEILSLPIPSGVACGYLAYVRCQVIDPMVESFTQELEKQTLSWDPTYRSLLGISSNPAMKRTKPY